MYPLIQTFLVYKSRQKWSKFKAIVRRWAMRWCSTTELVLGTFFPWDPSLPQSFTISSAVHSLKCSFCMFVLLQISIDTCFSTNKIAFRPKKILGFSTCRILWSRGQMYRSFRWANCPFPLRKRAAELCICPISCWHYKHLWGSCRVKCNQPFLHIFWSKNCCALSGFTS